MAGKFNLDDYVPVAERVTQFRKDHPKGRIVGTLLSAPGAKDIVMRADVYLGPEDFIAANGHAQETVGQGMVNTTSAMENCETSAWGRALANLGYEISRGIASREEMASAERRQGAPPPARQSAPADKPTIRNPDEPASVPQRTKVGALIREITDRTSDHGIGIDDLQGYMKAKFGVETSKDLTKGQMSEYIDFLQCNADDMTAEIARAAFSAKEVPDGDTPW